MAKMTKKELDSILRKDAPGYEVVQVSQKDDSDRTKGHIPQERDAGTPSLSQLKQKMRKVRQSGSSRSRPVSERKATQSSKPAAKEENDREMIVLRPKGMDASHAGSGDKVAIVSKKDKRITGMQG